MHELKIQYTEFFFIQLTTKCTMSIIKYKNRLSFSIIQANAHIFKLSQPNNGNDCKNFNICVEFSAYSL